MIMDAVARHVSDEAGIRFNLRYVLRDQNFEAIINRILQLLFAPDVSLRRLVVSASARTPGPVCL